MKISKKEELKIAEKILKEASEIFIKYKPRLKWVTKEEAQKILGITSATTLQKLRDNNEIVYSKSGKNIMYDIESLEDFLERHSNRKRVNK